MVLIVDDDADVLDIVSRMVSRLGYPVISALSPWEALELVQDRSNPIAALLTDVHMPGMDGFELARRIQDRRPGLKVIFMSGRYGSDDGHGPVCLRKPFAPEQVAQALRV